VKERTPDALVFATSRAGSRYAGRRGAQRVEHPEPFFAPAVKLANERLGKDGRDPLAALTQHSLRRAFISVLLVLGEPVPDVMAQVGHTTPQMTLGLYAKVMADSERERDRLRALVEGAYWQEMGNKATAGAAEPATLAAA
jgi:integrase